MAAIYVIGLLVALLIGGAVGVFIMGLRNDRVADEYRAYEQEIANSGLDGCWSLAQDDAMDDDATEP